MESQKFVCMCVCVVLSAFQSSTSRLVCHVADWVLQFLSRPKPFFSETHIHNNSGFVCVFWLKLLSWFCHLSKSLSLCVGKLCIFYFFFAEYFSVCLCVSAFQMSLHVVFPGSSLLYLCEDFMLTNKITTTMFSLA